MEASRQGSADLLIRPGEADELDAIFALECASFSGDRLSRRALRRFLKSSHHPLLVARSSGRLIGYILISLHGRSSSARIYSLAVEPAHGRRGVGRELLHAAERYARMYGRNAVRLEVRYDNAAAIALYEKNGYRNFGSYPAYYDDGAEALRFEKKLTTPPEQK